MSSLLPCSLGVGSQCLGMKIQSHSPVLHRLLLFSSPTPTASRGRNTDEHLLEPESVLLLPTDLFLFPSHLLSIFFPCWLRLVGMLDTSWTLLRKAGKRRGD